MTLRTRLGRLKSTLGARAARTRPDRLPALLKARIIERSGLVDVVAYQRATGRPVRDAREAARAFVDHPDDPGSAINPLFDADWYRSTYGLAGTGADLLVHYILFGERGGLKPCVWFDPAYFLRFSGHRRRVKTALAAYCLHWDRYPRPHPHFDGEWYLWQYQDVRDLPGNPLAHFVRHGLAEGREPNAFVSARWYLATFDDIRASGQNPVRHFIEFGAAEMRSPGPNFDMRRYADEYPDYAATGLDPLAHYLAIGRAEGRRVGTRYIDLWDLNDNTAPAPARAAGVVDVIVPVYRGLDVTRACVESLLASRKSLRIPMRIRLCNDASPEPEVTAYLREVAAGSDVVLTENAANLGFVGTVNAGMRAALAEHDCIAVVLLNSDAEVANDWLDRLHAHALKPGTGTVTATSNNATICSFPQIGEHRLSPDFSVAEVDRIAARVNAGESVEIPTAVGFCMFITRPCLDTVGLFDEEAFGRGYGEENDFCMRATAAGYRHLHALDVFVHHIGEVSFAADSNPGKENAGRIISERYPHYNELVARFCARDPARTARLRLTFALWRERRRPVTALITHDLGGGTERHVLTIADALGRDGHVVIVRPSIGHKSLLRLESRSGLDRFDSIVDALDGAGFASLLGLMGVDAVQIHHLYDHGDIIRDGLARARMPFTFDVHDYFVICPQITLTTVDQDYCGEPPPSGCDACIAQRPSLGATDIRNWREAHEWAVIGASEVRVPSHDVARRLERYFPVSPVVRYHQAPPHVPVPAPRVRPIDESSPLRVVMLGVMSLTKGRIKVFQAIEAAERLGLPIAFHLIGDTQAQWPNVREGRLTATGWYTDDQLPTLLEAARPDVFLFASAAPETYSFTLTEAMATGRPILATDLGAFAERLAGYPAAALFPHDIHGDELARRLWSFARASLPAALFPAMAEA